ncbi:MAG: class I tRNA ligase family protein [Pararobbsia sp.]
MPSNTISSARTSSTSTPCSGRRCSNSRAHRTPTNVFAHGFLTVDGQKMSKSRGTFITAQSFVDVGLNPEWLRYYFAAKLNGTMEDIDLNSATSSRASIATSSASTSISRAAPRVFSSSASPDASTTRRWRTHCSASFARRHPRSRASTNSATTARRCAR